MKKLLLGLLLIISTITFSQETYFSFQTGYGLGLPGTTNFEISLDTSGQAINPKPLRLAGGLNVGASFGFMTRDNWGLDFNLTYQNQFAQTFESSTTGVTIDGNGNLILETATNSSTFSAYSIRFSPSLRIQADSRDLNPYLTVGPSVMYSSYTVADELEALGTPIVSELRFNNGFSFGGLATLGIEYELDRNILFFGALQYAAGYITPRTAEVTLFKSDGEDITNDLSESQRTIIFEDDYFDDGGFPDPDEPSIQPRESLSYNAFNVLVGVRLTL